MYILKSAILFVIDKACGVALNTVLQVNYNLRNVLALRYSVNLSEVYLIFKIKFSNFDTL